MQLFVLLLINMAGYCITHRFFEFHSETIQRIIIAQYDEINLEADIDGCRSEITSSLRDNASNAVTACCGCGLLPTPFHYRNSDFVE